MRSDRKLGPLTAFGMVLKIWQSTHNQKLGRPLVNYPNFYPKGPVLIGIRSRWSWKLAYLIVPAATSKPSSVAAVIAATSIAAWLAQPQQDVDPLKPYGDVTKIVGKTVSKMLSANVVIDNVRSYPPSLTL